MERKKYPIRENYYEEIKNKKLEEFYLVIQIITVDLNLGEKAVLEKSKVYVMYGINVIGKKTILGLYVENKNNSRYWLDQIEKIKYRGLKKVLYVSMEENKKLEQALKIVYNPIIKTSITRDVEKIAEYVTRREWPSMQERKLIRAYLSETEEGYHEKIKELKEEYKGNQLGIILLENFEKKFEKQIRDMPKEIRHLICSYSIRTHMKRELRNLEREYADIKDVEDLFEKKKEYFRTFERTRSYGKLEWMEILNKIYEEKYEEIKEYV